MIQVDVQDAQTGLTELLRRVENGESVVIARAGIPVAGLTRVGSKRSKKRQLRTFGGWEEHKDIFNQLDEVKLHTAWRDFWNEDVVNP